jgi:hypothetical protein
MTATVQSKGGLDEIVEPPMVHPAPIANLVVVSPHPSRRSVLSLVKFGRPSWLAVQLDQ